MAGGVFCFHHFSFIFLYPELASDRSLFTNTMIFKFKFNKPICVQVPSLRDVLRWICDIVHNLWQMSETFTSSPSRLKSVLRLQVRHVQTRVCLTSPLPQVSHAIERDTTKKVHQNNQKKKKIEY
jgi:hypothetical protein